MNAGRDFNQAIRQAQANAKSSGVAWAVHGYNTFWWVSRVDSFTTRPPEGAVIIHPDGTVDPVEVTRG